MNGRRKLFFFLFIVVLAGLAVLFYVRDSEKEPIVIGFVAGLSGKFADLGIDCRRGLERAVEVINRRGGVKGRLVMIDVRDDKQDPEQAREIVSSFLKMNLPVIIGHVTSSMSMATLPLVNNSDTLMVSPTTSTPLLKDKDDNFIRTCAVSTDAAIMMAKYLRQKKGAEKAVVIYDTSNSAYTERWYQNFRKTFLDSGGTSIVPLSFDSAPDLQMLPLIGRAKELLPDALVIVSNSVDAALLCQQVRKTGWQIPLALSDWAATEQLINLGGVAVEGAVISQYFNRKSTDPRYLEFKKNFMSAYKTEPGFGALHSFNAGMMVFESMQNQQDNETLKDTILRISEFEGLQGNITINRYGDSSNPTFIGIIQDGNFVILEDFH